MGKNRRGKSGSRAARTQTRAVVAEGVNPPPQTYSGVYRFPGKFAFIEKLNIADYALLQADDPFTGRFEEVKAEQTCISLQSRHQGGDPAAITGRIITCDVEGRQTPVLFMFD